MSAHDWGVRLSDRVRTALAAGDPAAARRLVLAGDGQARSLEKEYSLMYRGLGITLRVLLDLAPGALGRMPERELAGSALVALLGRFRDEMRELMARAYGAPATDSAIEGARGAGAAGAGAPAVERATGEMRRALVAAEVLFIREQACLARRVVAALDAGDVAGAGRLIDVKEGEQYLPLHDRMIRFMAEVFGWVFEHGGPAGLLRFHRDTAEGQREGFERWERLPAAEFARATAFLLKQHMGRVQVSEDHEKFTVEQTPCGSGGRLRLLGAYAGPQALPVVEAAGPLTSGEERLPVYCTHCPVWNGLAPLEWFGRPHWVFDRPSRPDGSCTLHIYKGRDGAPAEYARRLGLARPGP